MELISNLSLAQNRRCTTDRIKALNVLFQQVSSGSSEVTLNQFQTIVKSKNPFFVERVFRIFDADNSGTISRHEFIESMKSIIICQGPMDKLRLLFQIYDLDGNGCISVEELRHVMKCCMEENGLSFSEEDLDLLTRNLFEDANEDEDSGNNQESEMSKEMPDSLNEISFDKLVSLLDRSPGLLENVAISVEQWLLPPIPEKTPLGRRLFGRKLSISYIRNNLPSFLFLLTFLTINAGLIMGRFYSYRDYSYFVKLAKSAGQCLNFTCSFTLILMLRKTMTILRSYGCARFLPLDQSIYYHKMIGYFVAFYAVIHTVNHCFHFRDLSRVNNVTVTDYLFTVRENTWPREFTPLVGWFLLVVLIVMVLTSLPVMRRTGNFEVFYYCHLLYIAFYILLVVHAPNFWIWLVFPGLMFTVEALNRLRNSFGSHGYTYIEQGVLLPSRVVHLIIRRPPNFNFSPGDWVYVQIPEVAKTEWHPFTISSAPEMDDHLWLHIRAVGEWTNRVYDYFLVEEAKLVDASGGTSKKPESPSRFVSSFELPLKRGKSFPPNKPATTTPSPVQPAPSFMVKSPTSKVSQPPSTAPVVHGSVKPPLRLYLERMRQNTQTVSTTSNGHVERLSSTPLPTTTCILTRPLFTRTLSTVESQLKIPFDRRQSKIFVLPKPDDSYGCKRKRFASIMTRSSKAIRQKSSLAVVAEEGRLATGKQEDSMELLAVHDDFSTGRVIKLEKPLHLHLDGPYGSPSSHIFYTEHAILIGTGIGVTPFASILQSIMYRYMKTKNTCPKCQHTWSDPIPGNVMNLKKVDFMWINRNQKSFEWFVSLLSQLEITQAMLQEKDRFLDIHMYVTSALDKSDMKAIGLQLALDLMHEKEKRDLITGLKTRTQPGRPDWNCFFRDMAAQRKGRVTVFFCGPPELGRTIQSHCIPFGFAFKKEIF